ncbi:MOSC domain-containing protein [Glaciecola petra]|uniref:MOSC domain-containing protein n=1 Tax=Glaciecola petra TaxID=3075602 RepID=A0ABU2ZU25_9ALTE|nr:MOSC domain-containing protein [Aestuariibacter sp. P117]MDT0596147.1 MOSC domain-containing protein [Aestuariibacter sp. P117]
MHISHLFAGKPQPFGPRKSPSSIIKSPHTSLHIDSEGANEDEQGNKKLHGGPFMAIHQYAQDSYSKLADAFPNTKVAFTIGSIGENISAPEMNEDNVYIGDKYAIGSVILEVVSPRAPCSKINHRYGVRKIDLFIAEHALTGWYFRVAQTGQINCGDKVVLVSRNESRISVKDIWKLRQLKKQTSALNSSGQYLEQLDRALQLEALSPEWQGHLNTVKKKMLSA